MNYLSIRRARRKDIDELIDLMLQYIVDFYKRPRPEEKELRNLIEHLLSNPEVGVQFVAELEGKLVGFSTLYFTFSTTRVKKIAILNDLFVAPKTRGMKVGEELFKESLAYTKANDYAAMSWQTAHDNLIGQSLYEKMGGQQTNDEWINYEISNSKYRRGK
ncbi:GNAT family N-acetyltransferase [Heyndrickxia sporothermodurans]|uniref:GNAT family N-acetyltransferase n=1 Tax=Heyndrickxia sporothermodurans TaxID=46224 RepID=UPI002DBE4F73|nr:GNAT family N-acetyltransferase [Heyndrickxia sporothermodurans]MEB6549216.1 GNAT family N-acetyltransferase [Heyndrickxia sporothermodurans]